MHLCGHDNEVLLLDTVFAGTRTLFQIDTGYAGAPVLSKSFLSVQDRIRGRTIKERYASATSMSRRATSDGCQKAMNELLGSGQCRAFTSGCTMRLMGIGSTSSEMQSDMLLCPALAFVAHDEAIHSGSGTVNGDVFMTHPLKGGVHILTCDYLLHRSPSVLCPADGALWLGLSSDQRRSMESTFAFHDAYFVGGAFAIVMNVGGHNMRIVVDTGATAPLSLGRTSGGRIKRCSAPPGGHYHVTQTGVNGERICSTALSVPVKIGSVDVGIVEAFVNGDDVEGADGYAGLGLLRVLDLWLEPHRLGIRRNRLSPTRPTTGRTGKCDTHHLPSCAV